MPQAEAAEIFRRTTDLLSRGAAEEALAILVEAVRQLMGKAGARQVPNPSIAVETSVGGSYMDAQVLVLSKEVR